MAVYFVERRKLVFGNEIRDVYNLESPGVRTFTVDYRRCCDAKIWRRVNSKVVLDYPQQSVASVNRLQSLTYSFCIFVRVRHLLCWLLRTKALQTVSKSSTKSVFTTPQQLSLRRFWPQNLLLLTLLQWWLCISELYLGYFRHLVILVYIYIYIYH